MTVNADNLLPESAQTYSNGQRLFMRYFTATLIDLVVLELFAEYSSLVVVESFTISLLVAIVLQILLKVTIAIEHKVAAYFNAKSGGFNRFMRFFCAWLVIFGSKFVILEAIAFFFGKQVHFGGPFHGLITLIVVIVVMLVIEELVVRIYRRLG